MLSSCCALLLKWTITKFHSNTTCNINYALHQHVSTHIVITRLCIKHTGCIKMTGVVWKSIIFTSMVKILINTSTNERVTLQVYDRYLQMFTFFGPRRKDCLTRSTLSSDTRGRPALFSFTKAPHRLKLLIPASNAIGRWGITIELSPEWPLNRNNWFVLHKLQHTKRLLLRSRHYRFVTSQTEREEGSGIEHAHKTWTPAVSFHVGNLLLRAFWKP